MRPFALHFPFQLWRSRYLLVQLTRREILGRYRGSLLGWGWTFLQPLAMLSVYTFVFSQVFRARWGTLENSGPLGFAVNLFAGLIVFNLVGECVTRAPGLVLAQPNYVKKVVFPLEVLASVAVGTALFHAITSLVILVLFELLAFGALPLTFLWLPLVWLPVVLVCLAATWLLSALGVFLRDLGQLVGVLMSMLMFLSPIFYPISAMPPRWQPVLLLNPLAQAIEVTRRVTVDGVRPGMAYLLIGTALGLGVCELAFGVFSRCKRAFADVM